MIMSTLYHYDTGYNLTNLVEELLKIERKFSAKPSFSGVMSIWTAPYCWQTKFGTPNIVFLINLKLF